MTSDDLFSHLPKPDLLIIVGWAVLVILLFGGIVIPASAVYYRGDTPYFYSMEITVREVIASHQWPLWNLYHNEPLLANPQASALYPLLALLRFLPVTLALRLTVMLDIFLAGLGMYLLIRNFQLGYLPAITAMLSFALCTTVLWRIIGGHLSVVHVVPWIPLTVVTYRSLLLSHRLRYFYLTILCAACLVLGGHIQFSAIGILAPGCYFLYHISEQVRSKNVREVWYTVGISVLVGIVLLGTLAMQLLPMGEYLKLTIRARGLNFDEAIMLGALPAHLLSGLVLPFWATEAWGWQVAGVLQEIGIYAILPAIGFALLSLFHPRGTIRRLARFILILGVLAILIALGYQTPLGFVVYRLASFMREPGRFLILWTFAASILNAIGIDVLFDPKSPLHMRVKYEVVIGVVLLPLLIVASLMVIHSTASSAIPAGDMQPTPSLMWTFPLAGIWLSVFLLTAWWRIDMRLKQSLILGALLIDTVGTTTFSFNWAYFERWLASLYNELVESAPLYSSLALPQNEVRLGYLNTNSARIATIYRVPDVETYTATLSYVQDIMNLPIERRTILLAAGCQITTPDAIPEGWEVLQRSPVAVLSRDPKSLPRFFATTHIQTVDSDEEEMALIASDYFDPQKTTLVHAAEGEINLSGEPLQSSIDVLEYSANTIRLRVNTDQPAMLVLIEAYYPGWVATVNGQSARIWRVDHASRGVLIPAGDGIVTMTFVPASFYTGMKITLATLVLLILVPVMVWVRKTLK